MTANELPREPSADVHHARKGRIPPMRLWTILLIVAALMAVVRNVDVFGDHAVTNIATWILGFIGVVALAIWFLFRSGYGRLLRLAALAICVAAVVVAAFSVRIERLDGDLWPTFSFSFEKKPDQMLPVPEDNAAGATANVDLRTTTENDFPEFLGPHRSEGVDHLKLSRNWAGQPPKLVWRQKIGAGWSAFSVVNGHAVTLEQRGDMEMTTCYNVETGRLEWSHSTPGRFENLMAGIGPRSTPTIDEGMVYALGARGNLVCLSGANGKPIWEKNLLEEYDIAGAEENAAVPWGRANSPLIVGELLIVPVGGHKGGPLVSLAAFDKRTGVLLWNGGNSQISYSSPNLATLAGVRQILIVNEKTASGHDPKTGKVLWEFEWPGRTNGDPNVSQAVPIAPDCVLLSKGYGGGAALVQLIPAKDGAFIAQAIWKSPRVLKTKFTNAAVLNGYAYGLSDGILECVNLATGQSKWKQGRYGHGQILRVGDLLLVSSEQGEILLVEATPDRPNSVLGRFQAVEGITWNNPALYGPYLLVRNAEEAACYKLPLEEKK
jgi:outer membrane protein assembly factor BamB